MGDEGGVGSPVIRVDLNFTSRAEAEINEPDYATWAIEDGDTLSRTFDGVTVEFQRIGDVGTMLTSNWYKAGAQSPCLARLANDGLVMEEGADGAQIQMTISGLAEGEHTLLTYHNTFADPSTVTFAPLDISMNGVLTVNDLAPTDRVAVNSDAMTAYLKLHVVEGERIVVLFQADSAAVATDKHAAVCGFELNTPDVKKQSTYPSPRHYDEHVNADNGTLSIAVARRPKRRIARRVFRH